MSKQSSQELEDAIVDRATAKIRHQPNEVCQRGVDGSPGCKHPQSSFNAHTGKCMNIAFNAMDDQDSHTSCGHCCDFSAASNSFKAFLTEEMKDPEFANAYAEVSAEVDADFSVRVPETAGRAKEGCWQFRDAACHAVDEGPLVPASMSFDPETEDAACHAVEPCPEPEPCAKHPHIYPTLEPPKDEHLYPHERCMGCGEMFETTNQRLTHWCKAAVSSTQPDAAKEPQNLACWTEPSGNYPAYISINYVNTMVEITVRSTQTEEKLCGSQATVKMNKCQFASLIREAEKNLT